jgi:hypothetical protein
MVVKRMKKAFPMGSAVQKIGDLILQGRQQKARAEDGNRADQRAG